MRFGSRKDDDGRASEVVPASRSAVEVAPQPVVPSKRLQRVAEHFHTQAELLTTMRQEFESEMEPLHELLVHQTATMQRMLSNFEERLRPLNEYADGEAANLDALEHRMNESGSDHVARSFAEYLADQRSRIAGTREQIDQQRMPFLQYGEEQRDTVEVALSRFDSDMDALETNLAEQRKVMLRMLDLHAVGDLLRREGVPDVASGGAGRPRDLRLHRPERDWPCRAAAAPRAGADGRFAAGATGARPRRPGGPPPRLLRAGPAAPARRDAGRASDA